MLPGLIFNETFGPQTSMRTLRVSNANLALFSGLPPHLSVRLLEVESRN